MCEHGRNCLDTSNLIILGQLFESSDHSIPLICLERKWTWTWSLQVSSDHPILYPLHPFPDGTWIWSITLRRLIWSSHPLLPSPASTSTWSFIWRLIWPSLSLLFICLQEVSDLAQLFEYPSSDHPLPPSPDCTSTWPTIEYPTSDYSIPSFLRLQIVRQYRQLFEHPLN